MKVLECFLALNGECKKELLKTLLKNLKPGFIIGVDGGTRHFVEIGVKPDLIIGDMDSLELEIEGVEVLEFPEDKDEIDAELALDECFMKGGKRAFVACWRGERVDMEYALLLLLKKYGSRKVVLLDEKCEVFYVEGCEKLKAKSGEKWSILPLGGPSIVTLEGFKYEIREKPMPPDKPYGVSNVALGNEVKIEAHRGGVVVIRWLQRPL